MGLDGGLWGSIIELARVRELVCERDPWVLSRFAPEDRSNDTLWATHITATGVFCGSFTALSPGYSRGCLVYHLLLVLFHWSLRFNLAVFVREIVPLPSCLLSNYNVLRILCSGSKVQTTLALILALYFNLFKPRQT